jgi:uncharacterized membrane-anchored protein
MDMIRGRAGLALALALPIVALLGWMVLAELGRSTGRELTLPITGADPRDLLAGHYLTYQVDFGLPASALCSDAGTTWTGPAYVCLEPAPAAAHDRPPPGCTAYLRGRCAHGRFLAGIERFYIPEDRAQALDRLIRAGRGAIVIALQPDGDVAIQDLLIDGHPWREALIEAP